MASVNHSHLRYRGDEEEEFSYRTYLSSSSRYYNPIRALPNMLHEGDDEIYSHYSFHNTSRPSTPLQSSSYYEDVTDLTTHEVSAPYVDLTDVYHVEERYVEDKKDDDFLLEDKRYTHPALESKHNKLMEAVYQSDDRLSRMRRESDLVDLSCVSERVSLSNPDSSCFQYIDLTQVPSILDDEDQETVTSLDRDWDWIHSQHRQLYYNNQNWEVQSVPDYQADLNFNSASFSYSPRSLPADGATQVTYVEPPITANCWSSTNFEPHCGSPSSAAVDLVIPAWGSLEEQVEDPPYSTFQSLPTVDEQPTLQPLCDAPASPTNHPPVMFRIEKVTNQLKAQVAQRHTQSGAITVNQEESEGIFLANSVTIDPPGALEFKPSLISVPDDFDVVNDPPGQFQLGKTDASCDKLMQPPGVTIVSKSSKQLETSALAKNDAPSGVFSRQQDCPATILRQLSSPPSSRYSPASILSLRNAPVRDFVELLPIPVIDRKRSRTEPDDEFVSCPTPLVGDFTRHRYQEIIVVDSRLMESVSFASSSDGRESRDGTEKVSNLSSALQRPVPITVSPMQAAAVRTVQTTLRDPIRTWMPSQANANSVMRRMAPPATREEEEEEEEESEESTAVSVLSLLLNDSVHALSIPSDRVVKECDGIAGGKPSGNYEGSCSDSSSMEGPAPSLIPNFSPIDLERQETLSDGQVYCDEEQNLTTLEGPEVEQSLANDIDEEEGDKEDSENKEEEQGELQVIEPDLDPELSLDAEATYAAFCISDSEREPESEIETKLASRHQKTSSNGTRNSKLLSLLNLWEDRFKQKTQERALSASWEEETLPSDSEDAPTQQTSTVHQELCTGSLVKEDDKESSTQEYTDEEVAEMTDEEVVELTEEEILEEILQDEDNQMEGGEEQESSSDSEDEEALEPDESYNIQESSYTTATKTAEPNKAMDGHTVASHSSSRDRRVWFKEDLEEINFIYPFPESCKTIDSVADVWSTKMAEIADKKPLTDEKQISKTMDDKTRSFKEIGTTKEMTPGDDAINAVADLWAAKMADLENSRSEHVEEMEEKARPNAEAIPPSKPDNVEEDNVSLEGVNYIEEEIVITAAEDIFPEKTQAESNKLKENLGPPEGQCMVAANENEQIAQGKAEDATMDERQEEEQEKVGAKIENSIGNFADFWDMKMSKMAEAEGVYMNRDNMKMDQEKVGDTIRNHEAKLEVKNYEIEEKSQSPEPMNGDDRGNESDASNDTEEMSQLLTLTSKITDEILQEEDKVLSQMSRLSNFMKKNAPANLETQPEAACTEESLVATSTSNWSFKPNITSFIWDLKSTALSTLQSEKPAPKEPHFGASAEEEHEKLSFCDSGSGMLSLPTGCALPKQVPGAEEDNTQEAAEEQNSYTDHLHEDISEMGSEDQFINNIASSPRVAVTTQVSSALRVSEDNAISDTLLPPEDPDDPRNLYLESILSVQESASSQSMEDESTEDTKEIESNLITQGFVLNGCTHEREATESCSGSQGSSVGDYAEVSLEGLHTGNGDNKNLDACDKKKDKQATRLDPWQVSEVSTLKQITGNDDSTGAALADVEVTDSLINLSFDNGSKGSSVSALNDPIEASEPQEAATLDMECLQVLVTSLMTHEHGFEFSTPLDMNQYPDYDGKNLIYRPLDLGTILRNLINGQYDTILDFQSDMNMVFLFRMKHSKKGSKTYKAAKMLKKKFEKDLLKLLDDLESKLS